MSDRPLTLITGGLRRLGAVIAARFAAAGHDLALVSHVDMEAEGELAAALSAGKGNWAPFLCDLSIPENAATLIAQVTGHFGRSPDNLVNNAAIFGQDDRHGMSPQTLAEHFALNNFAPVLLARELADAAGPEKPVSVVHILDQRIRNPHGDQLSYTLSKQALASSVRTLAAAFAPYVRVNGVAPGLVIETGDYDAAQLGRLSAMMPLSRLPRPENVAEAVLYLTGAADVTGQILYVDGGAHLKAFDRDFMHL